MCSADGRQAGRRKARQRMKFDQKKKKKRIIFDKHKNKNMIFIFFAKINLA